MNSTEISIKIQDNMFYMDRVYDFSYFTMDDDGMVWEVNENEADEYDYSWLVPYNATTHRISTGQHFDRTCTAYLRTMQAKVARRQSSQPQKDSAATPGKVKYSTLTNHLCTTGRGSAR